MLKKILHICLILLPLWGCEKAERQGDQAPLVVILSPDNPPFEFKDTARGGNEVIGFDIDIIKEIGRRLGRPIKILEAEFGAIIPSLQAGRADLAISELSPSEERKKSVDFSDTYYLNPAAMLVPQNSLLTSVPDLKGKKVGAQLGSANEVLAYKWAQTISGLEVVSLGKVGELVQELKNGRLDAVLVGGKVAQNIAHSTPGLKVIKAQAFGGECAIACPKGSSLVREINKALKEMGSEIQKASEKWIGQ